MLKNSSTYRYTIILLLICGFAHAAPPSRTYTYNSGDVIDPDKVTTNEDNLYNYLQVGVDRIATNSVESADIQANAITSAKLASNSVTSAKIVSGTIVNSDISSSAGITDNKLSTISTAGKVNGTAIVGLPNLPSGAGVVPVANLGSGTPGATNYLRGDGAWTVFDSVKNSIEVDSNQLQLSGDTASPGNSKLYGTNSTGDRGWQDQPSGTLPVVYCWSGTGISISGNAGMVASATNTNSETATVYNYIEKKGDTNKFTALESKFLKSSSIDNINVWCAIRTTGGSSTGTLTLDIGGQSVDIATTNTTINWNNATLDITSLTNDTIYDLAIKLNTTDGSEPVQLYSVICIAE